METSALCFTLLSVLSCALVFVIEKKSNLWASGTFFGEVVLRKRICIERGISWKLNSGGVKVASLLSWKKLAAIPLNPDVGFRNFSELFAMFFFGVVVWPAFFLLWTTKTCFQFGKCEETFQLRFAIQRGMRNVCSLTALSQLWQLTGNSMLVSFQSILPKSLFISYKEENMIVQ